VTEEQDKDIFVPRIPVVPDTWEVLPFAKAAKTASDRGKKIKKKDYLQEGKIPVIDQGQEFIGGYTDDDAMAYDGDLPVILFGDHTRAFKYVDKPFAVGADGVKILKPSAHYDPKFFYYLLRSLRIPSRGYSRHFQFLKKFHLPLAPRQQQKRIVAEIEKQFSRLDEAVANLKRVKANLKRYKAAVLKAAVEGKLTEEWRKAHPDVEPASKLLDRILAERRAKWEEAELAKMKAKGKVPKNDKWKAKYKGIEEPDTSTLSNLPEGWLWTRLDTLAALKGGITVDRKRKDPTARSVPYLRVANVQRGYLDLGEVKEIAAPEADIEALRLVPGDILFNEGGDRDKLGRGWVWEGQLAECIHQNHVFRARLYSGEMVPKLISWWGNSFGQYYFLREGKQTTNLASINLTKLSAFPVPLPPLAEQEQIAAEIERRLSLAMAIENETDQGIVRAERLRQSLLTQAFSGALTSDRAHSLPGQSDLQMVAEPTGVYGANPATIEQ